jgi:glycosyltransferase involved in cell wall biosynthesis
VNSLLRKKATTPATVPRSVRVKYLIDATGAVPKPLREHGLSDAQCSRLAAAPSHLVKPEWEQALNRLTDIELEAALAVLDSDVLVTANPALMAVATAYTPARVALVHQEHRVSELRGPTGVPLHQSAHRVDGLVALSETTADWFAALFGAAAPKIAVIGNAIPGGYRPRSTRRTKTVTIAGRLVTEKQVHHAIQAFGKVARRCPRRACTTGCSWSARWRTWPRSGRRPASGCSPRGSSPSAW